MYFHSSESFSLSDLKVREAAKIVFLVAWPLRRGGEGPGHLEKRTLWGELFWGFLVARSLPHLLSVAGSLKKFFCCFPYFKV